MKMTATEVLDIISHYGEHHIEGKTFTIDELEAMAEEIAENSL